MVKNIIDKSPRIRTISVSCCRTSYRSFLDTFSPLKKCEKLKKIKFVNNASVVCAGAMVVVNECLKSSMKLETIRLGKHRYDELSSNIVLRGNGV